MRHRLYILMIVLVSLGVIAPVAAQPSLTTYISQDGTVSISYPESWSIIEYQNGISVATSQYLVGNFDSTIPSGEGRFTLTVIKPDDVSSLNRLLTGATSLEKLQSFVEAAQQSPAANATLEDAEPIVIGEYSAAQSVGYKATDDGLEVLLLDFENGSYAFIVIESAPGELARIEPKMHSIAASIKYPPVTDISALLPISLENAANIKLLSTFNIYSGLRPTIALSPDGQTLASGDINNGIRLWATSTGRQITPTIIQDEFLGEMLFTPDGKYLVTGDTDGAVRLWEIATGEQQAMSQHDGVIEKIVISPDGKLVAYTSFVRRQKTEYITITLWNLTTHHDYFVEKPSTTSPFFDDMAFSPDSQQLLYTTFSGGSMGVQLYDLIRREGISNWSREGHPVGLFFTADSQPVVILNSDEWPDTALWNPQNDTVQVLDLKAEESFFDVFLRPEGNIIVTTDTPLEGSAHLRDGQSGNLLATLSAERQFIDIVLSADGRLLVTVDFRGNIMLWGIRANN